MILSSIISFMLWLKNDRHLRILYGIVELIKKCCNIGIDFVIGIYCRVLTHNIETALTLNIDGTYLLIQTFKEKQNEREKLRGTFQVLDGNILMLVHPSSGDNIFYKVRENKSVILLDSFGNEPQNVDKKNYTLKMKSKIV